MHLLSPLQSLEMAVTMSFHESLFVRFSDAMYEYVSLFPVTESGRGRQDLNPHGDNPPYHFAKQFSLDFQARCPSALAFPTVL